MRHDLTILVASVRQSLRLFDVGVCFRTEHHETLDLVTRPPGPFSILTHICKQHLLAGVSMGRLRVYHQLDTATRLRIAGDGALFKSPVHQLHHVLHTRAFA